MSDEILLEKRGRVRVVTLNRPKALNAVTLSMVRWLRKKLAKWATNDKVSHVILRAAGDRAFSAGGDIQHLYEWGRSGDPAWREFFQQEYRLNAAIKHFPKPYVALIGGIVMGGGVGVSVHGSHRVGTERMRFAMPEVGIGMFPDVGGSWFLPRLPGEIGTYLALTGHRISLEDARWSGIVTSTCKADKLDDLIEALADTRNVEKVLSGFDEPTDPAPLENLQPVIDRTFSADSVEDILDRLGAETGEFAGWAEETTAAIRQKSPTSLKLALRQLREGAQYSEFDDCMRMEFRMVDRVMRGADFYEGIRAAIIDKDNAP
ncbi:MAG: enoyl-CoA hydratase/isomerase family protein, partial [Hyphomicrobiales bacterium]|nr:enoyl-CoA hydratase/isomerase family protein [Hyphomicrobiales bacterium]